MNSYHTPVLLNESVSALEIEKNRDGVFVDATLGGGGHSREIISRLGKNGRLIVFDKDSDAIANAPKDNRVITIHNDFRFMSNLLKYHGFEYVNGVLADLGVSSHQFDVGERGFSFRFDSRLDMRMNQKSDKDAVQILNSYNENELATIFKKWGEAENSHKAARLIEQYRRNSGQIDTTQDLHEALKPVMPRYSENKWLAKIYQALRIEVNGEMESLEGLLNSIAKVLLPGGVASIITYHSLEDRMVKNFFRSGNIDGKIEKNIYGVATQQWAEKLNKVVKPSESELDSNSRSRSAKLRVAIKS